MNIFIVLDSNVSCNSSNNPKMREENGYVYMGATGKEVVSYQDWKSVIRCLYCEGIVSTDLAAPGEAYIITKREVLQRLTEDQRDAITKHARNSALQVKATNHYDSIVRYGRYCIEYGCRFDTCYKSDSLGLWALDAVVHPSLLAASTRTFSVPVGSLPKNMKTGVVFHVCAGRDDALTKSCRIVGVANLLPVEALFACMHPDKIRYGTSILECELCLDKAMAMARASGCYIHAIAVIGDAVLAGSDADEEILRANAKLFSLLSDEEIDEYVTEFKKRSTSTVFVGGGGISRVLTTGVISETEDLDEQALQYDAIKFALRDADVYYDGVRGWFFGN